MVWSAEFSLLFLASMSFCFITFSPYVFATEFPRAKLRVMDRRRRFEADLYTPVSARQMYCYSCMSRRLQDNWQALWQLFRRPEHFTESCDPDHFRRGIVKFRNCTDHCIWLISETQVYGQKIPVYTRGCMSDVLNYRRDAVHRLRIDDGCVRRHLSELFNDGDRRFPQNEIVTLCACHSNYCNGATGVNARWFLVAALMQLLIASGFWRCFTSR